MRTFDPSTIQHIAEQLEMAEASHQQIPQLSASYPGMTVDDSYAIQSAWIALKRASGRRPIGAKVGLTSRAMQAAVGIDEPDFGVLLDDMLLPENAAVLASRFIEPRVEVELAFVLERDLCGPGIGACQVLDATAYVIPALEFIDARIQRVDPVTGRTRRVRDTIADNAANAALMLGGNPIRPGSLDLRWCGALLSRNGLMEETGIAAGVLNHPANGVAWLANRLAREGHKLSAGDIVLSGSFTRPLLLAAGDVVHADFGRLGSLSFHMA
ncbi:2-oxo-hepta-3-ene-1,7-dioic acid hydratase [Cupriavidus basilensis]|uniref:2-oxo-hepta-3-ene-1,7-dioic acid hydratase n=1 Tax=Cupriavidus basilensis TaxID=68895 RepID=A0ABT6ARL9_9BURK|nr:2-oxo-hepta-3-ene-1,7-dioic acid hydratase [Cupriavidus basilensis]MDF3835276.1 2-oxo-hepta-3-ene-1,7-dioic acid hydratase [Cupriavidus basilensis]